MWPPTRPFVPGGTMRMRTLSIRGLAEQRPAARIAQEKRASFMSERAPAEVKNSGAEHDRTEDCRTPDRHPAFDRLIQNNVPDHNADVRRLRQRVIKYLHRLARPLRAQQSIDLLVL